MLIDLDDLEIKRLINGLSWTINETNCPKSHAEEYRLIKKLEYFLEEYTGIEND